ncbi:MAG: DUF1801 domain-containing protein [Actinobacteria bacterium]|nr:MAG: DUF1801 domain-containing protein [Actinomycetota bacterium]
MTIDEYLETAPEPHGSALVSLRELLRSLLPDASEEMAYGVPAFKIGGKSVAGYAYFKGHCSYFPHSGSVLPEMAEDLEGYDWDKGTLRFPPDAHLPESLVEKLVAARLKEIGVG